MLEPKYFTPPSSKALKCSAIAPMVVSAKMPITMPRTVRVVRSLRRVMLRTISKIPYLLALAFAVRTVGGVCYGRRSRRWRFRASDRRTFAAKSAKARTSGRALDRPVGYHTTVLEPDHAVRPARQLQVMGHDHEGHLLLPVQASHQPHQLL